MQSLRWNRFSVLPLLMLFASTLSSAQVTPCEISPGKGKKNFVENCERGEDKISMSPLTESELNLDDAYHLVLGPSLFNVKRTIKIKDSVNQEQVMSIEVSDDHRVSIKSNEDGAQWVIEGIPSTHLKELSIQVSGTLVILNPIEVEKKLEISSDELYLFEPFTIHQGTFKLKYKEGTLPRIVAPMQNRFDVEFSLLESLGEIKQPSTRRIALSSIPQQESVDISVADFDVGFKEAFNKTLLEAYPHFPTAGTEQEKKVYIKKYVLPHIDDNKKKGIIGETLHQKYMETQYPQLKFNDSKVGANSFDAIYTEEALEGTQQKLKKIIISEVKYAAHGKPVLGVIKLDGHEWRQLSTPYVKETLKMMSDHSPATKLLAKKVNENANLVKLQLAVYNPHDFVLTLYDIGTMNQSHLN